MQIEDILSTANHHSSSWWRFGQFPLLLFSWWTPCKGPGLQRWIYKYVVGREDIRPKKEVSFVFQRRGDAVHTHEEMEKLADEWRKSDEFHRVIEMARESLAPRVGTWRISLEFDGKCNKMYIVDISLKRYGARVEKMDMGLCMIPVNTLHPVLHLAASRRVTVVADAEGEHWVLKESIDPGDDAFVAEVSFMLGLPASPYALRPSAGVVEKDEQGEYLVGYLLPFHPASSISLVFRAKEKCTVSECASCNTSWRKHLGWAIDASEGLRWLHRLGHAWGDMKMDNLILCQDDKLRLIDYAPGGKTEGWIAPELEKEAWDAKTMAGDVFSLGLVLWCLVEEVPEVEEGFLLREGRWTQTNPAVPEWYVGLVDRCLALSPAARPTADEVCDILAMYADHVV